jgi:hypothetical protein
LLATWKSRFAAAAPNRRPLRIHLHAKQHPFPDKSSDEGSRNTAAKAVGGAAGRAVGITGEEDGTVEATRPLLESLSALRHFKAGLKSYPSVVVKLTESSL